MFYVHTIVACMFVGTILSAIGQTPSNRELIGCLPEEVESVMILRAAPLVKDGSPFQRELQGFFGIADKEAPSHEIRDITTSTGENNLDRVVLAGIISRKPAVRLLGGWDFSQMPAGGIGLGTFRHLQIWITADAVDTLCEAVEKRVGVVGPVKVTRAGTVPVYSSEIEVSPTDKRPVAVFFSFPSGRIVVRTESIEQMELIVAKLAKRQESTEIPPRWKAASAAVELESPILLLRKLKGAVGVRKYDLEKPEKIEPKKVEIDSFALAAPNAETLRFQLRCITPSPDDAVFFFYAGTFAGGFPPVYWKWKREVDAKGFTSEMTFDAEGKNHHLSLVLISLFGIPIGI